MGVKCPSCGFISNPCPSYICNKCGASGLEVIYDYGAIRNHLSNNSLTETHSMWRYNSLLPLNEQPKVGSQVGFTPLLEANNLSREFGLNKIFIKDDSVNHPTLSYKDRAVAVAVNKALEFGFDILGCVSTGNVSNSVSSFAATLNKPCFVVVPGGTENGKVIGSLIFGAKVIKVRGNYDTANMLCKELAKKYPIAFANINLRSYYSEGAKTAIYEIVEQLGWRLPQNLVLPLAGGTLLIKAVKAIRELVEIGLVKNPTKIRIYGAQATGSSPIALAFELGQDQITPVQPNTIAKSLAIGNPGDGIAALQAIKSTNGYIGSVTDEEIIEGIGLLASKEGVFAEASGGATVGLTKKLAKSGVIPRDEEVVVMVSGNGFKTPDPVANCVYNAHEVDGDLTSLSRAFGLD